MQQLFGKYELLDRLAIGGMAEIFLARQTGLEGFEKPVVLKRIRPHLSDKKNFVKMFLNEAKLAAQLNHHNVVQILDLGKVGDSFFIAMEYLFGRDMRRVVPKAELQGISFPIVYACKIASQVLEGLFYAHQKTDARGQPLGIVHRDVTPENIFVTFDGGVKILDFGIAKAANIVEQTRAGEIKGKLSYMSPEQCAGKPLDHRSDLFSLGVVLYEWVTGFKLFTGESDVAVLKSITDGKIYRPSYFKADVPEAVEQILMRALEKNPDDRFQTAWEMQFELDRFLANNEFTPSNNHLATFVKQLFADEIDAESKRLLGSGVTISAIGGGRFSELDVDALAALPQGSGPRYMSSSPYMSSGPRMFSGPSNLPIPTHADGPMARGEMKELRVPIDAASMAQLLAIAERLSISPERLVEQLVQSHLSLI